MTRGPHHFDILTRLTLTVLAALLLVSCGPQTPAPQPPPPAPEAAIRPDSRPLFDAPPPAIKPGVPSVVAVDLDALQPRLLSGPVSLSASKNEWTSFVVRIDSIPRLRGREAAMLRIHPLRRVGGETPADVIAPQHYSASQVLSMPIDASRAGYVRHTGLPASLRMMPRALLPLPMIDGLLDLATARDPSTPLQKKPYAPGENAQPLLLWIDLHVPIESPAGEYVATCDLMVSGEERPIAQLQLKLSVYDFVLPDERHLVMVGTLPWDDLTRLFPDRFEAITPRLINRADERYAPAVRTFDQIIKLAQAHRLNVVVPRLQPTVKWPANREPRVDWVDFDSVVGPWMRGDAFADKVPLSYWPLPMIDHLDRFDRTSQLQYWLEAATHFDQLEWLDQTSIRLPGRPGQRAGAAESVRISAEAAQILRTHPRLRVTLPLEDDQVQLATGEGNADLIPTDAASRLIVSSPSLVFAPPIQRWPDNVAKPSKWLRTDLTGLVPYFGAGGDERDVRLWAWLAFLRQASYIHWDTVLPQSNDPSKPAEANELIWVYPGSWFGVDEPVPTVQLKWLRRAQQDYEYLWLAQQRGEVISAMLMARLITKPVEILPHQLPDPTYALMCGTSDPQAWVDAQRLLASTILLREPGQKPEPSRQHALNLQMLQWIEPQERPLLMGHSAQWLIDRLHSNRGELHVGLKLGVEIYNASDSTPDQNLVQWTVPMPGGSASPQEKPIPALATYRVARFAMEDLINIEQAVLREPEPIEITFTNGFTKRQSKLRLMLPIAASDRREGRLAIDGSLGEWSAEDALQDGPMVKMLSRPALQAQKLETASTPTSVYSAWAEENFYLAFKMTGIEQSDVRFSRNFVDYQARRAWGEDLGEVLIQPIYDNNELGPVLHVVVKPSGIWVERKLDPKTHADPWQLIEGANIRYAATLDGDAWRGELAIPWKVLLDPGRPRPALLRFNFVHHRASIGESSSWAGPIDYGRDDSVTGLIFLREPNNPGM